MSTAETTMKTFVEKYRDLLLDIVGNLFILGLLLLLLHNYTYVIVSIWIDISLLTIITFASGFGYFLIYIQKDEEYFKTKTEPYFRHLFLAGLLIVTAGILTFDLIENNELLNSLVSFISSLQFYLIQATIGFGFITFYFNRDKLEDIEETHQEELLEKQREMEFAERYSRINRVWGVRRVSRWIYKEGWWHGGMLLLILIVSLCFMLNHLGQFMSVDEPKWLYVRVPLLYESISTLNLEDTYINDKPGMLPAALSGITLLFLDTSNYSPETFEQLLFWWRLPIVLFNILMLIIIYVFLQRLFDRDFAILCTSLIALNPVIVGISQIVNPDATLWSTGFVSFLSFFLYIKLNMKKYIYISGFFLGLALLSKYFSAILYIVFISAIVIEYMSNKEFRYEHLNTRMYDLCILVGISIFVYTIFFPATWFNPEQIFRGTIGADILSSGYLFLLPALWILCFDSLTLKSKLLNYFRDNFVLNRVMKCFSLLTLIYIGYLLLNLFSNYYYFDIGHFMFWNRTFIPSKLHLLNASTYVTILTLMPSLLLGMLLYFITHLFKKSSFFKVNRFANIDIILYSASIFIFMFILGASIGGYVALTRYQILLYPMYSIITTSIVILLLKKEKRLRLTTVLIILLSIIILLQSAPFYLHYTNEMNIHDDVIYEAWGYGGYELAQKINELPNAENISVWTDREGFKQFFVGKTYWRGSDNPFELEDIDYLVLTYGGEKIFTSALYDWNQGARYLYAYEAANTPLLEYYNNNTSKYQINIDGNPHNYVKVVEINKCQ